MDQTSALRITCKPQLFDPKRLTQEARIYPHELRLGSSLRCLESGCGHVTGTGVLSEEPWIRALVFGLA